MKDMELLARVRPFPARTHEAAEKAAAEARERVLAEGRDE